MRAESSLRLGLHLLLALICTVAIALALGAVWMAITLSFPSARWWFAVPVGVAMGYTARAWITHYRWLAVALAVLGTVLALIYMKCLYVGLELSAVMGLGLLDTLQHAGAGMLLALADRSLDTSVVVATLVGMALAAWLAWRRGQRTVNRRAP